MLCSYSGGPLVKAACRVWALRVVSWRHWSRGLATIAPDVLSLPAPSPEQDLVIKAVRQGRNARVTAVAGSGKTTTILQVAKAFPNRKILGTPPNPFPVLVRRLFRVVRG
jgi:hypothetical protein